MNVGGGGGGGGVGGYRTKIKRNVKLDHRDQRKGGCAFVPVCCFLGHIPYSSD